MPLRHKDLYRVAKSQADLRHPHSALWIVQKGKLRHAPFPTPRTPPPHNSFTASTTREIPETGKVSGLSRSRVLLLSLLVCLPLCLRNWARGDEGWGASPSQGGPGPCGGSPHAHPRTHTKLEAISAGAPRPALALPENAQLPACKASLGSRLGLLRTRALPFSPSLSASPLSLLSLFPPHTSTLTPSSRPSPSTPSPPPTQRHRSCYWGSLERGAIPSPAALLGAKARAPAAGPQRSLLSSAGMRPPLPGTGERASHRRRNC